MSGRSPGQGEPCARREGIALSGSGSGIIFDNQRLPAVVGGAKILK